MKLQELIDQLTALQPTSAREATVMLGVGDEDSMILSVKYDHGVVTIEAEDINGKDYEDGKRDGRWEA